MDEDEGLFPLRLSYRSGEFAQKIIMLFTSAGFIALLVVPSLEQWVDRQVMAGG